MQRVARFGVLAGALFAAGAAWAEEAAGSIAARPFLPRSGPRGATLFVELSPEATGLVTENRYDDPSMWVEHYAEFAVGAVGTGIAIGDYDNDGRPDVFVVSKTDSCRLFRNLGGWKFEDVTDRAGVGDRGDAAGIWKQGATFADVNNDGLLDLYVCRFNAPNLLYVNQGNGTFREEAAARGLAVNDASVMAAFCDYDRDGWLDVFVQTNSPESAGHPQAQRNYLLHNTNGTFTDVTDRAGIRGKAQGHSATWWDYDNDGWPDLYVANDFTPADQLWHNHRDQTFTDTINTVVPRMSFSSMGADLGDVNNDGLIDLLVADMAATSHQKDQRTMANARRLLADPAETAAPFGMRNMLFLNTGTGRMQEAAFLAGLSATDWTWSVRLEDLDNDGRLDVHVTNGMYREPHNADLMARVAAAETTADKIRIERGSPVLNEQNLAFRNLGDLQFEDVSAPWGLNQKGVSFGAAFGDLDGDGDLDLVYANYKKGVTILRNDSDAGHRVSFALRGTRSNRFGVGATIRIETAAGVQMRQLVLARGVVSSSEPVLHFGLGDDTQIKRATITWPSGHVQEFTDLAVDQKYTITEPSVGGITASETRNAATGQFREVSQALNLFALSRESPTRTAVQSPLVPMRGDRRGPAVAIGDVNGDGKDDVVVGGTVPDPLRVLVASGAASFAIIPPDAAIPGGSLDGGPVLLFDVDGDGDNDLLVTKSGDAQPADPAEYQPRLWLNDGRGRWRAAPAGTLPELSISAGAVAAADFDRDGRLDVFLGARTLPGRYPFAPKSALLANRGGRLEDVTEKLAPGLREVGMVTSALWSDADGDGWLDLLVTLEWGLVKYFHNERGRGFSDRTEKSGFASAGTGWWNSIAAADFNGDGRPDYVVGNLGLNTQYHADAAHPALFFSGDFTGGGSAQPVEAYYEGDTLYPWRTRKDLGAAIPSILSRFPRNDAYARATLGEILGEDKLATARRWSATEFRSGVLLSQANGAPGESARVTHRFEPLPRIAQIAPIQGMVAGDFDGDGRADICAVQNSYAPIPAVGRFDGGLGQLLRGDGQGHFTPVPPAESGLIVPGDAKALAVIDLDEDGWADLVVSRNNSTTLAFRNDGRAGRHSLGIRLRGPAGNPAAIGARITLELSDGSTQTSEVAAGVGYYSQSAAVCFFGWAGGNPPRRVGVRWPSGEETAEAIAPQATSVTLTAPASPHR